jgi:hypothetical protein
MAEPIAMHIVATDADGNIVHDSYAAPEEARYKVKLLKEELLKVTAEPVTELPAGVELPE